MALTRVGAAPLREGNRLGILRNGPETYDEWLREIGEAKRWVHLENYIFKADGIGHRFAEALSEKAADGVPVRVLVDWLGSLGVPRSLWEKMARAGVDVRAANPPTAAPLGLLARDHRKLLAVDGTYASVGGVCIEDRWLERAPETGLPYRDTAVGVGGPVVADLERAFAGVWNRMGEPLPAAERLDAARVLPTGRHPARAIIAEPGKTRIAQVLAFVAAAVERRLWISDAYFVSAPAIHGALVRAAQEGVDVRLLLPATNDLPLVGALSRTGYRQLLEAGIRIFEYVGPMTHAKTLVADGYWSRIGSTNLNILGLLTNWELDLLVEDPCFGAKMEAMFEDDLANAREINLGGKGRRYKARPERPLGRKDPLGRGSPGSGPRALSRATQVGATAIRVDGALGEHERAVGAAVGAGVLGASLLCARFPRLFAWPLATAGGLLGASALVRATRPAKANRRSNPPGRGANDAGAPREGGR